MGRMMWTVKDAADAWGMSIPGARKLMGRVPGVERECRDGVMVWLIPEGSKRPEPKKAGRHKKPDTKPEE